MQRYNIKIRNARKIATFLKKISMSGCPSADRCGHCGQNLPEKVSVRGQVRTLRTKTREKECPSADSADSADTVRPKKDVDSVGHDAKTVRIVRPVRGRTVGRVGVMGAGYWSA